MRRVLPANESLDAHQMTATDVDFWLVVQDELSLLERHAQALLKPEAIFLGTLHLHPIGQKSLARQLGALQRGFSVFK